MGKIKLSKMFMPSIDESLANPEWKPDMAPIILFKYQLPYSWSLVSEGFFKKYNWQPRTDLSTVTEVKQIDDDTIGFYRRHESCHFFDQTWEKVTINRVTKEIKSEIIANNHDESSMVVERTTLKDNETESCAVACEVYETSGNGNLKVEVFKH